jgi:hypothetical protein
MLFYLFWFEVLEILFEMIASRVDMYINGGWAAGAKFSEPEWKIFDAYLNPYFIRVSARALECVDKSWKKECDLTTYIFANGFSLVELKGCLG